jgi:SAM-dependent methyltransferase
MSIKASVSKIDHCERIESDPSLTISFLHDEKVREFIEFFFLTRYDGLIDADTEGITGFSNTNDYVAALLNSLLTDVKGTRSQFFADRRTEEIHRKFRQRNGDRKFLFEAKAIVPFIEELPAESRVIDLGAGDNSFLHVLKGLVNREDIKYIGTDIEEDPNVEMEEVEFRKQISDYEIDMETGLINIVILKASAHHIEDLERMFDEIKRLLRPGGKVILIEESCDNERPREYSRLSKMLDTQMNEKFYDLNPQQCLNVMKFLDYYGVRIYRGWSEMPLPLRILSSDQWISKIEKYGLSFKEKVNMGFANNKYTSCLQRCNLVLVFECVSDVGKEKVGNSVDEDNDVTG